MPANTRESFLLPHPPDDEAHTESRQSDAARKGARATIWAFDDVIVTDLIQNPVATMALSSDWLPHDDRYVSVGLVRSGSFCITHRAQRLHFGAGCAALLTHDNTASASSTVITRTGVVSIPLDRLLPYTNAPSEGFASLGAAAVRESPFFGFLEALINVVSINAIPSEPTAKMLTEMVAALILETEHYRDPVHETARPATIDRSGPGRVAVVVPPGPVMLAMLQLQSPAHNHLSPEQVAAAAGFSNLRSFRRTLTKTYGTSIETIRASQI